MKTKYNIDTSDLEKKISDVDKKIPDISGVVKELDYSKITEIESKIPSITGLSTTSVLTAVENKIPNVNILIRKTDYDTKISETGKKVAHHNHDKYITTPEFNKFTTEIFAERLKQANSITDRFRH